MGKTFNFIPDANHINVSNACKYEAYELSSYVDFNKNPTIKLSSRLESLVQ